jgi:hypothetical protein
MRRVLSFGGDNANEVRQKRRKNILLFSISMNIAMTSMSLQQRREHMQGAMKSLMAAMAALLLSLFSVAVMAQVTTEEDVPRITKEELKALLGRTDVVILDVRLEDQWKAADRKIPGAVHEDPARDAASWLNKYPKDKTVVLY